MLRLVKIYPENSQKYDQKEICKYSLPVSSELVHEVNKNFLFA